MPHHAPNRVPGRPPAGGAGDAADRPGSDLPTSVALALGACHDAGTPTPATVEAVMRAVRARPVPVRETAAASRARPGAGPGLRTRTWRRGVVAASLAGVAAAAGAHAWSRRPTPGLLDGAAHPPAPEGARATAARAAHFLILAPGARRVAVVGDFNGWDNVATPMHRDPDAGTWTASVALREGRYVYAYLVDGVRWVPDPNAPLAPADGFGRQSSVLVLSPQYAIR